jgi:hypothetical protein
MSKHIVKVKISLKISKRKYFKMIFPKHLNSLRTGKIILELSVPM